MKKVRLWCMAWGWAIDAYRDVCLPSLMQRDNIPWLVANDFEVTYTFYTLNDEAARLQSVLAAGFEQFQDVPERFIMRVGGFDLDPSDGRNMKRMVFLNECQGGMQANAPVLLTGPDAFYGNGSIRNISVYGQKPGSAIAVLSSRVKEEPFLRLLGEYRSAFGERPVSNAALVDMALRCEIDPVVGSNIELERNASFQTGGSYRRLTDEIHVGIYHLPSPVMFWPTPSDVKFFDSWCYGVYESIDHHWPQKLLAERRWRFMASSDLFFLAELNSEATEKKHAGDYSLEDGKLYNERFEIEMPSTQVCEMVVATLRREPYLTPVE